MKISRASYYKWLNRIPSENELFNERLLEIIKGMYYDSNEEFSSFTIHSNIKKVYKYQINHKRIERLMSINNLKSVFRKKTTHRFRRSTPEETAENILDRNFSPQAPNKVWLTDITEEHIGSHKEYICTIFDPYDNMPIAKTVSSRNDTKLVNDTLHKAHDLYPSAKPVFHSDRGFQFTRKVFRKQLEDLGYTQSMSRVSRCIDNCPIEGFQGIMKDEMKILFPYADVVEFRESVEKYYYYYIHDRPQRRFKGKTPHEVRLNALTSDTPPVYPTLINYRVKKYWKKIDSLNQL